MTATESSSAAAFFITLERLCSFLLADQFFDKTVGTFIFLAVSILAETKTQASASMYRLLGTWKKFICDQPRSAFVSRFARVADTFSIPRNEVKVRLLPTLLRKS